MSGEGWDGVSARFVLTATVASFLLIEILAGAGPFSGAAGEAPAGAAAESAQARIRSLVQPIRILPIMRSVVGTTGV